jgi:WD40 repeat protein
VDVPELRLSALAFAGDGRRVALVGNSDGTNRLVDTAARQVVDPRLPLPDGAKMRAVSPDGQRAVVELPASSVEVWDSETGRVIGTPIVRHEPYSILSPIVSWSPASHRLLLAAPGHVQVWDTMTGRPAGPPVAHAADSWSKARLSPDGSVVMTTKVADVRNDRHDCRFWDAATGEPLPHVPPWQPTHRSLEFVGDGQTVLLSRQVGPKDTEVLFWDPASGRPRGPSLHLPGDFGRVSPGPDTRTLWTEDRGQPLHRLWDAVTGKAVCGPIRSVAFDSPAGRVFSPDGKLCLTSDAVFSLQLWDLVTGRAVGPSLELPRSAKCIAFHPDGTLAASGGDDGTLRFWRVPRPVDGSAERIRCWVEVLTGQELDADGTTQVLDLAAWQARRQRLRELGGPPAP